MPKHLQGGKFTTSHTTVIDEALRPMKAVAALPCVSKISLGHIKVITSGPVSIKCLRFPGGVLVKFRGRTVIQEIRVYTDSADEVEKLLEA
ncbi:MAG: hypothetical protein K0S20_262 [Patescibacteria group bacterium]|jgi:hypothetical protein|nr:hypothetical protein [Patescibacteria group bacterium]